MKFVCIISIEFFVRHIRITYILHCFSTSYQSFLYSHQNRIFYIQKWSLQQQEQISVLLNTSSRNKMKNYVSFDILSTLWLLAGTYLKKWTFFLLDFICFFFFWNWVVIVSAFKFRNRTLKTKPKITVFFFFFVYILIFFMYFFSTLF